VPAARLSSASITLTSITLTLIRLAEYDRQIVAMFPRKTHQLEFDKAVDLAIASDPDCGDVIPGTGGFRKMRAARPDSPSGKSGGARVIYYYVRRIDTVFLFTAYLKAEADNLSENGKKTLRTIAAELDRYEPPRRKTHTNKRTRR